MRNFVRAHKLPILIFFLALAARLVLFSINFSHNDYDFIPTIKGDDGYYELSQSIIEGRGFTWDTEPPYTPNPLRPPVWPYLIAFFAKTFGTYWAAFAFEIVLGSLIPMLAYFLSRKVFGERAGRWTGFIMCFEPYLVLFSIILYTETSFIFFFLLSLVFFLRYLELQTMRNAIWFGVLLALATLIKPTVQYLPILIPIGLAILWRHSWKREHLKHLGAFLLVFLVLMAPWFYRNKAEFGVWGISAQPAFNLYVYLVPTVLSIEKGTNFQTEYDVHIGKNFNPVSITLANSEEYTEKSLAILKQHPAALIKSTLITLVTFFTHDGMLTVLGYSGVQFKSISKPIISLISHPAELARTIVEYAQTPAILILIMRLFWMVVTAAFVFGAWRFFRKEGARTGAIFALCLILYFAATTSINGLGVNARFRMPVELFILGFALYGLFSLKRDNTRA